MIDYHGEQVIMYITRDIGERRKTHEAQHRREEEFRALAENIPDIVARFDRRLAISM